MAEDIRPPKKPPNHHAANILPINDTSTRSVYRYAELLTGLAEFG